MVQQNSLNPLLENLEKLSQDTADLKTSTETLASAAKAASTDAAKVSNDAKELVNIISNNGTGTTNIEELADKLKQNDKSATLFSPSITAKNLTELDLLISQKNKVKKEISQLVNKHKPLKEEFNTLKRQVEYKTNPDPTIKSKVDELHAQLEQIRNTHANKNNELELLRKKIKKLTGSDSSTVGILGQDKSLANEDEKEENNKQEVEKEEEEPIDPMEARSLQRIHNKALSFMSALLAMQSYLNIVPSIQIHEKWLNELHLAPLSKAPISTPLITSQTSQLAEIQPPAVTLSNLGLVPLQSPELTALNVTSGTIQSPEINTTHLHQNEITSPILTGQNLSYSHIYSPELTGKNVEYVSLADAHLNALSVIGSLFAKPKYINIVDTVTKDSSWLSAIAVRPLYMAPIDAAHIDGQDAQLAAIQPPAVTPMDLGLVPYTDPQITAMNLTSADVNAPNINAVTLQPHQITSPDISALNLTNGTVVSPELLGKNVHYVSLMLPHISALQFLSDIKAHAAYCNVVNTINTDETWLSNIALRHLSQINVTDPSIYGLDTKSANLVAPNIDTVVLNESDVVSPEIDTQNTLLMGIETPHIDGLNTTMTHIESPAVNSAVLEYAHVVPPALRIDNIGVVNMMGAHINALVFLSRLNAHGAYVNVNDTINPDENWLKNLRLVDVQLSKLDAPILTTEDEQIVDVEPIITNAVDLNSLDVESPEIDGRNVDVATIIAPRVNEADKVNLNGVFFDGLMFLSRLRATPAYVLLDIDPDMDWLSRLNTVAVNLGDIISPVIEGESTIQSADIFGPEGEGEGEGEREGPGKIRGPSISGKDTAEEEELARQGKSLARITAPQVKVGDNVFGLFPPPPPPGPTPKPKGHKGVSPVIKGVNVDVATIQAPQINWPSPFPLPPPPFPLPPPPFPLPPPPPQPKPNEPVWLQYDSKTTAVEAINQPADMTVYTQLGGLANKQYSLQNDQTFVTETKQFVNEYAKKNGMPEKWLVKCLPNPDFNAHILEAIYVSNATS